jgi:hypothetical protein
MKKYELKRPMKSDGWMVMVGDDFKTVKPSELKAHLGEGWSVIRARYFIITSFLDWWKNLKDGEKIGFVSAFVIPFTVPFLFPNKTIVNIYPLKESDYQKSVSDSLVYDSDDSITTKKGDYKLKSLTIDSDSLKTNDSILKLKSEN